MEPLDNRRFRRWMNVNYPGALERQRQCQEVHNRVVERKLTQREQKEIRRHERAKRVEEWKRNPPRTKKQEREARRKQKEQDEALHRKVVAQYGNSIRWHQLGIGALTTEPADLTMRTTHIELLGVERLQLRDLLVDTPASQLEYIVSREFTDGSG